MWLMPHGTPSLIAGHLSMHDKRRHSREDNAVKMIAVICQKRKQLYHKNLYCDKLACIKHQVGFVILCFHFFK